MAPWGSECRGEAPGQRRVALALQDFAEEGLPEAGEHSLPLGRAGHHWALQPSTTCCPGLNLPLPGGEGQRYFKTVIIS